jgi:cyclic pyranopterin monophosphate synthase
MIDISTKNSSARSAKARGTIVVGDKAYEVVKDGTCLKGDIFATARIAVIQAVKSASNLIPMCHPILIEAVETEFERDEQGKSVRVTVLVKSTGKTGVEMEAMCGAAAGCLTIYDMLKYIDRTMSISNLCLLEKTGGKSGRYARKD